MRAEWLCAAVSLAAVAAVGAVPMSDDLFYRAPRLFHMQDYDKCFYENSTYCMGVFELTPESGVDLYRDMMKVGEGGFRQNRSVLHRGICLNTCDGEGQTPAARFERCVDRALQQEYGLRARLQTLNYCKSKEEPGGREMDYTDWLLASVIGLVVLLNVVGTVYDYKKDTSAKPNKFLMAWSIPSNWSKLTAVHSGDQRLDALAPIHGIKAHMILLVILSHTTFSMVMVYPYDERTIDDLGDSVIAAANVNGTITVQTFATIASFLLAYMLIANFEKAKKTPSIMHWPAILFNRFMRMAPALLFVVGVTATWVARVTHGPLWYLVEEMEGACRKKWWAQLLFVNNIIYPDDRCMVQSWFFAVDMQLFVGALALTLALAARPRWALRALPVLYVLAVGTNLALNLAWHMEPAVKFITLDVIRTMAINQPSYIWMFSATWTSIPSCLHGLMLAFLKHHLEKIGFKPEKHKWIGKVSYALYPCMVAWLCSGDLVRRYAGPLALALYASFDRTIWNLMVTFLIFAYIHGQGGIPVRYLSWSGFQVMGRVVYSAMLTHWHVNLMAVAALPLPVHFTLFNCVVYLMYGVVMSMAVSVPLHLLVEMPVQKMMG